MKPVVVVVVFLLSINSCDVQTGFETTSQSLSTLPVRIQAEDFDAFFDTTPGNSGARYRNTDVDITNVYPDDGTYEVGWTAATEWLQYTVHSNSASDYVLRLRVAQYGSGGALHVAVDGTCTSQAIATTSVPDTAALQHWVTMPIGMIHLTAGDHTITLCIDTGGFNLNWLEVSPRSLNAPGRIEAEDFDPVEGTGYHDNDPTNTGGAYRASEGVDIVTSVLDADIYTTAVRAAAGEFLKYSVQVVQTGSYVLRARVSHGVAGGAFHWEVDGANVTGTVAVPASSATSWVTMRLASVTLTAGAHTVRAVMETNGSDGLAAYLNWFELSPENVVTAENRASGTTAWRDAKETGGRSEITYVGSPLKGYSSASSVNKGGSLTFYIQDTNGSSPIQVQVFRMGYYGGAFGRLMLTTAVSPQVQRPCAQVPAGQFECNWDPSYILQVPTSWVSGVYVVKLTAPTQLTAQTPDGIAGNYFTFVVRDDSRPADFLYVQPMSTYQAYNNYPSVDCFVDGPGVSLYSDPNPIRVSFKRPLCGNGAAGGAGGGSYASGPGDANKNEVLLHELNTIAFLESNGYDVTYASSLDLHTVSPETLRGYRAVISSTHDEYWSSNMRVNAEEARDRGVNLAFMGANSAYWQVRFEDSNSTMVCYKTRLSGVDDPMPHAALKTTLFRDDGRPEQWLIGLQFGDCCASVDRYWPLRGLSSPWLYAGSPIPVTAQTSIDLTVGHEVDNYDSSVGLPAFQFDGTAESAQPSPARLTPSSLAIVATSPFWRLDGYPNCPQDPLTLDPATRNQLCGPQGTQNSSIYRAPSGAYVFDAGTVGWSLDLANVGRYFQQSPIIQTATRNVLDQFLSNQVPGLPVNQAAGATTVARSWYETTFWAPEGWLRQNVVDGRRNSAFGTSLGYTSAGSSSSSQEEWIYLQLPSIRTFSKVVLFPRNDPGNVGAGFPVDFTIQVWNGASWITRVAMTNYPQPSSGQSFTFGPDTTDRIRIDATRLRGVGGVYYLQLAEIEVY